MIDVYNAEGLVGNSAEGEDEVLEGSVAGSSWYTGGVGIQMYQGKLYCLKSGGHVGKIYRKDFF